MFRFVSIFLICLSSLAMGSELVSSTLKSFSSDGCSSFPEGTFEQRTLWHNCCVQHDIKYWQGGTHEQRLAADKDLEQCVAKVGEPKIAKLMLAGVRVGGGPYWPTSYRWGYGWPYFQNYGPLSEAEKLQVQIQLKKLKINLE